MANVCIAKRGARLLGGQSIGVANRFYAITSSQVANDLRDKDACAREDELAMHKSRVDRHARINLKSLRPRMSAPCETVLSPPSVWLRSSGRAGGTRTPTRLTPKRILSPLCLPFHHRPVCAPRHAGALFRQHTTPARR